jgi:IS5 family transposase
MDVFLRIVGIFIGNMILKILNYWKGKDRIPDRSTIWLFRGRLTKSNFLE